MAMEIVLFLFSALLPAQEQDLRIHLAVYAGDRMMARAFLSQILLAVFNGRVGT
jgi:hypothetical protein